MADGLDHPYVRMSASHPASTTRIMTLRRALLTLQGLPLLFLPHLALAQAQSSPDVAVRATISRLFDGMRAADSGMVRTTFATGARFANVDAAKPPAAISFETPDRWLSGVAKSSKRWDERVADVQVRVDGNIAQVWAPYTFYLDGKIRHCGVDAVELLLDATGWKITQLSDTRRTEGCREVAR